MKAAREVWASFLERQSLDSWKILQVDGEVRRQWGKGQNLWGSLHLENERKKKSEGDIQQSKG